MNRLEHRDILKFVEHHFVDDDRFKKSGGTCYGFSAKYLDAYFMNDRESFYRRLNILLEYKNNKADLFDLVENIRQRLKDGEEASSLTTREFDLLEVPAFLESITVQQSSYQFRKPLGLSFFSSIGQSYKNDQQYTKSLSFGDRSINRSFDSHHMLTKKGLVIYFEELKQQIIQSETNHAFMLCAGIHATALSYNIDDDCWEFLDINRLNLENALINIENVYNKYPMLVQEPDVFMSLLKKDSKAEKLFIKDVMSLAGEKKISHSSFSGTSSLVDEIFLAHNFNNTNHLAINISCFNIDDKKILNDDISLIPTNPYYNFYESYKIWILELVYITLSLSFMCIGVNPFISIGMGVVPPLGLVLGSLYGITIESIYDWIYPEPDDLTKSDDIDLSFSMV